MDAPDQTLTPLSLEQLVEWATEHAHVLYEGRHTPHRSCGIAIAETFGLATPAYQSLRKGGITGCGECGAIKAGELALGELLGDPDPTGSVTPALREAAFEYRALWQQRLGFEAGRSIVCNDLTAPFDDFKGPERGAFCTHLASVVAGCVAHVAHKHGAHITAQPTPSGENP